jgi:hypothetical protein
MVCTCYTDARGNCPFEDIFQVYDHPVYADIFHEKKELVCSLQIKIHDKDIPTIVSASTLLSDGIYLRKIAKKVYAALFIFPDTNEIVLVRPYCETLSNIKNKYLPVLRSEYTEWLQQSR